MQRAIQEAKKLIEEQKNAGLYELSDYSVRILEELIERLEEIEALPQEKVCPSCGNWEEDLFEPNEELGIDERFCGRCNIRESKFITKL